MEKFVLYCESYSMSPYYCIWEKLLPTHPQFAGFCICSTKFGVWLCWCGLWLLAVEEALIKSSALISDLISGNSGTASILMGIAKKPSQFQNSIFMKKIWRFLLFKTILLTGWRLQIKCSKTSFPRWRLWNPRDFQLSFSLWSFSAASAVVAYRQARDRFRSAGAAKPAGNYILLELWRSRWKLWREQSIIYVTSSHICFSNAEAGISSMDAAGPSPYARFLSTVAKRNTYFFSAMGKSQLGFPVGLYGDVNA